MAEKSIERTKVTGCGREKKIVSSGKSESKKGRELKWLQCSVNYYDKKECDNF